MLALLFALMTSTHAAIPVDVADMLSETDTNLQTCTAAHTMDRLVVSCGGSLRVVRDGAGNTRWYEADGSIVVVAADGSSFTVAR